jgi:predicted transposase YdaD
MKEQTNILLDKELKDEAKASGIVLGNALEEYLEMLLHKGGLKKKYEEKKQYHLSKAAEYREKIKEMDERIKREEKIRGNIEERLEKAVEIALKVHENEGGLDNERIRSIAERQIVPPQDLIDKIKEKFV